MFPTTLSFVKAENPRISGLRHRSTTILLFFTLGIVVPAGFLSYLGFRSYQYETVLLRKQLEERHVALADTMQLRAGEMLHEILVDLGQIGQESAFQAWSFPEMIVRLLSLKQIQGLPIENLYIFDAQNRMVFPKNEAATSLTALNEPEWGSQAGEIRRLENLEYGQNQPRGALAGYTALLKKTTDRSRRLALLNSMGGAALRIQDTLSAEWAYRKIISEFEKYADPSGMPAGLLARQRLMDLYDRAGRTEDALSIRLDILEHLGSGIWGLVPNSTPLSLDVFQNIEKDSTPRGALSSHLADRRSQVLSRTQSLLELQKSAGPFLQERWPKAHQALQYRGWTEQGGILQIEGPAPLWLLAAPIGRVGARKGLIIALIRPKEFLSHIRSTFADLARPTGLEFYLGESKETNKLAWKPALERGIDGIYPPLKLKLFPPQSSVEDRLSRKRLAIYGGMVGLSLLVIVIGLFMMAYTVRREVEIARLRSDFVANVSHELRTPLSAISYIADRLNRGRYESAEELTEFYGMLGEEAGRLQGLIDDVLDFSKMLSGKKIYNTHLVDLGDILQEALKHMKGKAVASQFELRERPFAQGLPVLADKRAVVHAITNLIDNAMKYSGASKVVEVELRAGSDRCYVDVIDHGMGIPEREQQRIFEKFYRAQAGSANTAPSGVGLGLAIVSHIMENHRGRVTVQSEVGKGSVFTLEFPKAVLPKGNA